MGHRFRRRHRARRHAGASHKYLGNPVLSLIGRTFFSTPIGDFHCGLRAFRRDSIQRLGLSAPGMEFAPADRWSAASIARLDIRQLRRPLLQPDRLQLSAPHLRTSRDGRQHLRFPADLCARHGCSSIRA